jgi:hypothetical protein
MAVAVITLGMTVLVWAQARSLDANREYSEVVDENAIKIREKLVFEYVFHNNTQNKLTVYMINCGESSDVQIMLVSVSKGAWVQTFSGIELTFLNGTPTSSLDINEEGVFELSVSLLDKASYSISILTERERVYASTFVA